MIQAGRRACTAMYAKQALQLCDSTTVQLGVGHKESTLQKSTQDLNRCQNSVVDSRDMLHG